MAEAHDRAGIICQNLIDAGCERKTIQQCMSLVESGRYTDLLPVLSQYRTVLLGTVRTGQKKIDCLDFLIYKIKSETL